MPETTATALPARSSRVLVSPALRDSIAGGVALELVPGSEGAASDYCVAICDEKDRPFLELFNQGLANIRANGIYDAILAKYADTL